MCLFLSSDSECTVRIHFVYVCCFPDPSDFRVPAHGSGSDSWLETEQNPICLSTDFPESLKAIPNSTHGRLKGSFNGLFRGVCEAIHRETLQLQYSARKTCRRQNAVKRSFADLDDTVKYEQICASQESLQDGGEALIMTLCQ